MTDAHADFERDDRKTAGDPAQAFEDLRQAVEKLSREIGGEMTVIRKGVETAFDQFDRIGQPVDYSADLGRLMENLARNGERLQAIEKLPVLRLQPAQLTRAAEQGGDRLVKSLARKVDDATSDLAREARNLAAYTKSARDRETQTRNLYFAGLGGLVAGMLLVGVVLFCLPDTLAARASAFFMHDTRWNAGFALMSAEDPVGAQFMNAASQLVYDNHDTVEKCRAAAAKTGRDQTCTIVVPGN
ncbi:hypothetical protein FIV00_03600 [Labrenzia sp. THAF82]|uniref:DUF6118 family protein n=1 Tax=Labrenzia sp. THAF82 TaxID=2587861 RepID=UPI00126785C9|nr:DUF6118 family protein [Labrenzia sp. THAF82]QFT29554.1 hypothetical protein FIV00_03600 [Labrenzia sp. THAF82]